MTVIFRKDQNVPSFGEVEIECWPQFTLSTGGLQLSIILEVKLLPINVQQLSRNPKETNIRDEVFSKYPTGQIFRTTKQQKIGTIYF